MKANHNKESFIIENSSLDNIYYERCKMLEEFSWELFEKTGDIDAYLLSKSFDIVNDGQYMKKTDDKENVDHVL